MKKKSNDLKAGIRTVGEIRKLRHLVPIEGKAVLVTTEFRGVFFGRIKDDSKLPAEVTLTTVRNCLYWSASCGGFLGLASAGPNKDCKIGALVPEVTLYKITSITPVSEEAEQQWLNAKML
jgi:hypothetical protein